MAYNGTLAQTGSQTIFNIRIGSTPTVISEILDFTQSGKQNATANITNLQSLADEFLATLENPGKYELTFNRVSNDLGQLGVLAAFNAKQPSMFIITLPLTSTQSVADTYSFLALVDEYEDVSTVSPTKQLTTKVGLKVSGVITFAPGH